MLGACRLGIVGAVGDKCAVNEVPVDEECPLQGIDDAAFQSQHGVSPSCIYISQGNIHAPHVAHTSVNDDEFSVVSIVDLTGKCWEVDGQVSMYFNTFLTHAFKETVTNTPASHVVVDYTHLDTFAGFVYQCVGYQIPQGRPP